MSLHTELKRRVNEYFNSIGKDSTGNAKLYTKAIVLITSYTLVYVHLMFFKPVWWIGLVECMILGILTAGIGFNVMHDGSHGSFSRIPWLNKLASYTLEMLGGSSFMWNSKHNIIHHAYTNIDGVDDDIDAGLLLRMTPDQKYLKLHKYQYIYFPFLYAMLHIVWVFFKDYKKYFSKKVGNVPLKPLKTRDHIFFWVGKVVHVFFYVVLPIYVWGLGAWAIGFVTYGAFSGIVLSTVFQLAHTVEETSFPHAIQPENIIEDEWALHQLKTTANFATRNKFITWWVGGLNFQVEHHLFPKISHIHYPQISKIVRETCQELGAPYIEHRHMRQALASHVNHLRKMGARHR